MDISADIRALSSRRVGDEERDQCTLALSDAFVAGRLPLDEFDHRSELALAAETEADLSRLTSDLAATTRSATQRVGPSRVTPTLRVVLGLAAFQVVLVFTGWVVGAAFDSASVSHTLITLLVWLSGSACSAVGLLLTRHRVAAATTAVGQH